MGDRERFRQWDHINPLPSIAAANGGEGPLQDPVPCRTLHDSQQAFSANAIGQHTIKCTLNEVKGTTDTIVGEITVVG